ncbi:15729_t:CDS:1, partial [Acaulospora morrowiae]
SLDLIDQRGEGRRTSGTEIFFLCPRSTQAIKLLYNTPYS